MTKTKVTKKALASSLLALMLCVSMLLGTTYAWFTDSVVSGGNIIKSGTLDVEMWYADGTKAVPTAYEGEGAWTDASTGAIFNYDLWEPGYTEVRHIQIKNVGTLALKYKVQIVANGTVSDLAEVIDVYYMDPAEQIADRTALAAKTPMGTLTAALAGMDSTASGNLRAGEANTVTIALKMQESAGNEYQNKSIGTDFSIQLLATQDTVENDSFDNQYDANAKLPVAQTIATAVVTSDRAASFTVSDAPATEETTTQVDIISLDNVSQNDTLTLNVKTQNLETANSRFTVAGNNSAVAGIDLTLTNSSNEQVTFSGTATITTYIAKGLTDVSVAYNGDGASPSLVSYDSTTGKLVFTTTHFSEYYVIASNEAYLYEVDTAYATLQQAVDAVESSATVVLLNDVEQSSAKNNSITVGANKTITLDTNGKTITANLSGGTRRLIIDGGSLTIKGNGSFVSNTEANNSALVSLYKGSLTVNGCSFATSNICIAVTDGTATINEAIFTAKAGGTGIYATGSGAKVIVNGLKYTCDSDDDDGPGACWAINGATISVYGGTFGPYPTLNEATLAGEVTGANYTIFDYKNSYNYVGGSNKGSILVYGGTFYDFNPASVNDTWGGSTNYIADGYTATETSTGVYTVTKAN